MVSKKPCVYRYDYHYHWFAITILERTTEHYQNIILVGCLHACLHGMTVQLRPNIPPMSREYRYRY